MKLYSKEISPLCVSQEMSSTAPTLGTWIRVPLKAETSAFYLRFVFSLVGSGLARGVFPVQRMVPTEYKI
jgi:hypothetical protein